MLKEYQRDYGIQALIAELNNLLGRDQMTKKIKLTPENGMTKEESDDAVSENPHLYRPVDYENKIYF